MIPDYKIVLCGEYNTGKTCMLTRLFTNTFDNNNIPTIGASFKLWYCDNLDKSIKFGLWDTAGQERFASLIPLYMRETNIVLYCWDCTKVIQWSIIFENYKLAKHISPNCIFYLVFTKIDLIDNIESIDLRDFSQNIHNINNTSYKDSIPIRNIFYTSALTGVGVKDTFNAVATDIIKISKENKNNAIRYPPISLQRTLPSHDKTLKDKSCCLIV